MRLPTHASIKKLFKASRFFIVTFFVLLIAFESVVLLVLKRGGDNQSFREIKRCFELKKEDQPQCLDIALRIFTKEKGIRATLDVIEPLSQQFTHLLVWSHPFAHSIGGEGLEYYKAKGVSFESQIGRALIECDGFGAFGCYHGVIEKGLSYLKPQERTQVIRKACLEDPFIQKSQYFINQCLHWFGHGMAIFTYQTLNQTLAACEGLSDNFESDEVQLCLSGVFHAGSVPGNADDRLLHNVANVWKDDDPYYPCLEIEEKFRGHCYSHAAGRTLSNDLAVNFRTCDNIPEPDPAKKLDYVKRCYDSAANTLLAQTLANPDISDKEKVEKVVSDCRTYSHKGYRRFCYAGAARYWVLRDPLVNNTHPFEICKNAEEDAKPACYANVGFGNNENYYSKDILQKYCQNSEPEYRKYCLQKNV